MPGIDNNNSRQPFEQIADYYHAEIQTGRLKAGDQLPSVRDIAAMFDVAIGTANNAIKSLKDAGLIMSWQGKGIFVRDTLSTSIDPKAVDPAIAYQAIIDRLDEIQGEMHDLSGRVAELERSQPQRGR